MYIYIQVSDIYGSDTSMSVISSQERQEIMFYRSMLRQISKIRVQEISEEKGKESLADVGDRKEVYLSQNAGMYVCMYVCVCVCVCMYVCVCVYVCMYVYMHVCTNECAYIYIYI